MIDVRTFYEPTGNDFELFSRLPQYIYPAGSPRFLRKDELKNPYLHAYVLLTFHEQPVGRLAVYNNPNLVWQNEPAACIGLYECTNDGLTSAMLFDEAKNIVRQLGLTQIIGPMNGSTWSDYRFSLNHAEPYFFTEPYHHIYYASQFCQNGFTEMARYVSQIDTSFSFDETSILPWEEKLRSAQVTIRSIRKNQYKEELELLFPFLLNVFSDNVLYTPVTKEMFMEKYLPIEPLLNEKYVLLATNDTDDIVAVFFAVSDCYNPGKGVIVKTVARLPQRAYAGITQVMSSRFLKAAIADGNSYIVHAFMHAQNTSRNLSHRFSGAALKEYALFYQTI